jgi:hypothetical protein
MHAPYSTTLFRLLVVSLTSLELLVVLVVGVYPPVAEQSVGVMRCVA